MKFGKDSEYWPKDSLKRSLLMNYPGCKSTLDAFNLVKSQSNQTATQTPSINEDYIIMRDIINELSSLITFDIDDLDINTRVSLADIKDPREWKDAWLGVIRSRGLREGKQV